MESLTLQVDGPITGRAYVRRGLKQEHFFCLQVDGPIIRKEREWGEGGSYNWDFMVCGHLEKMTSKFSKSCVFRCPHGCVFKKLCFHWIRVDGRPKLKK